ncbi:MAG: 30S ribosomal protein S6 [Opitutales bacterium]
MKNNKYSAVFILDTRSYEESVETLIEKLKSVITLVGGSVSEVENLGTKEFARVTDRKFPAGIYVRIAYEGPATTVAAINEKLRLDKTVNRVMIQSV